MELTNQFHDIIPGSSIRLVYEVSDAHYQTVLGAGASLRDQAEVALLGQPVQQGPQVCAVNTSSFERSEVIELPQGITGAQVSAEGKPLAIARVPSYGYTIFTPETSAPVQVRVTEAPDSVTLENSLIRAIFNRDGSLISLFDKTARREAIEAGKNANHFVIYDDHPNNWDAWDVDAFHLEKRTEGPGAI
jgi:alpha-mannosidase